MKLEIKDFIKMVKGELVLGNPKNEAFGASVDTRTLHPGDLFFALQGERVDGHDYALIACRQKASGVVVSRIDWMNNLKNLTGCVVRVPNVLLALQTLAQKLRHRFKGPVVGITGSNGKTTTKQMMASILETTGPGLCTKGNYNSQIGLPLVLSEWEDSLTWMVLEMGASEPGHIAQLAELARPRVGIITSIGPAHMNSFGSIEKVAQAKWELIEMLPRDGVAILPWGVPVLAPFIRRYNNRIVFFGEDSACPVRASSVEVGESIRFHLHVGAQSELVEIPMMGRFNVANALASAAAGWALGLSLEGIVRGLKAFQPPPMRMEVFTHFSGAILINDAYNANPTSMMESIRTVVETYPDKKHVLVLGSMLELGPDSARYHFHLGTELGKLPLEFVYLLGEEAKGIQEGAMAAGGQNGSFVLVQNTETIAGELTKCLNSQSVILLKGSRAMNLDRLIGLLNAKNKGSEKV